MVKTSDQRLYIDSLIAFFCFFRKVVVPMMFFLLWPYKI